MLRDIEEEEMNASMERVVKKQEVLRETSYLIGGIAVLSLIIVVVFIILITRDISRSQYYPAAIGESQAICRRPAP